MARNSLRDALPRIASAWERQAADGELSIQTVALYIGISERLLRFAAAHGVTRLDDITSGFALAFIEAPGQDRRQGFIPVPADGTRRQRRSALESLFAQARALGLTQAAPLIDLPSIPRSPRKEGADLTDADIRQLCFYAERGMPATRHAAILALQLAGLHSAEIAAATTDDLDLPGGRIWTGGATHTFARHCPLDAWAVHVLTLRALHLMRNGEPGIPQRLATNASSAYRAQASVCSGFGDIARHSGLATPRRRVEPKDITRYVARTIFNDTGQLSEVARRLGLSSLDSAAALAGYHWHPAHEEEAE